MRLVRLAVLVLAAPLALGAAARADGCLPTECGVQSAAIPGSGILHVRPSGTQGPLLAYDLATGRRKFRLPAGLLAGDGRAYVASAPASDHTTLVRYDARSGRLVRGVAVHGRWQLSAVSANGGLAVLTRYARKRTTVDVVHTGTGAVLRQARLGGSWAVETVSTDAKRLYLLQYLRNGYVVRLYDAAKGRLVPGALRVKGERGPMNGLAWSGLPSPDGRWLLTLFLSGTGNEAAIHTLDLLRSGAVCVDLPSSAELPALQQYGLLLTPDGSRVYAVNPALGVVAAVDLASKKVVRTTRFPKAGGPRTAVPTSGAVSADGRTLYFAWGRRVWAYDAAYAKVRGPYKAPARIAGLGFGPGDRRLWVVGTNGRSVALDARTGARLRS